MSTIHDLLVANKYKAKDGSEKSRFTNVGVAFENEKTGYSLVIHEGISLSGRVLMLPRKDKDTPADEADAAEAFNEQS